MSGERRTTIGIVGRARTVKPEFFQHDGLFDLEESTEGQGYKGRPLPIRVAFAGLFDWSDRAGLFEWKPARLKLNIAPYDQIDFSLVLDALERGGFIVSYVVDGKRYGWIPSFLRHQSINNREAASTLPPPTEEARARAQRGVVEGGFHTYRDEWSADDLPAESPAESPDESRDVDASGTRAARVEHASSTPLMQVQGEGSGGERKGKELKATTNNNVELQSENGAGVAVVTRSEPLPRITGKRTVDAVIARLGAVLAEVEAGTRTRLATKQLRTLQAEMIFGYWAKKHGHEKTILDDKRERLLIARLNENDGDVSELFYTVDGALRDRAIQGEMRDGGTKYDGVETIFRDRAQVERLARLIPAYRKSEPHRMAAKYADAFGVAINEGTE